MKRILKSETVDIGSNVDFTTIEESTDGYVLENYPSSLLRFSIYMSVLQDRYVKATNDSVIPDYKLLYFRRNDADRELGFMRPLIDYADNDNLQKRVAKEYRTPAFTFEQYEYLKQYWIKGYTSISNINGSYVSSGGLSYDVGISAVTGLDSSSSYDTIPDVNIYFDEDSDNYLIIQKALVDAVMNTAGDEIDSFDIAQNVVSDGDINNGSVHIEQSGKTKFPTFETHTEFVNYLKTTYGYDTVRIVPIDIVDYVIRFSEDTGEDSIPFTFYTLVIEGTTGTEEKEVKLLLRLKYMEDGVVNGNTYDGNLYTKDYLYIKENLNSYGSTFTSETLNDNFPLDKFCGVDLNIIDTSFESLADIFETDEDTGRILISKFNNVYLTDDADTTKNIVYYTFLDGDNTIKYYNPSPTISYVIDGFTITDGSISLSPDTYTIQDFAFDEASEKGSNFAGTLSVDTAGEIDSIVITNGGTNFTYGTHTITAIKVDDVWYNILDEGFDITANSYTGVIEFGTDVNSIDLLYEGLIEDDETAKFLETVLLNDSPYLVIHTDKRTLVINVFTKELIYDSIDHNTSNINVPKYYDFDNIGYNYKSFLKKTNNSELFVYNKWNDGETEFVDLIQNGKFVKNKISLGFTEVDDNTTYTYNINRFDNDVFKIKLVIENSTVLPTETGIVPNSPKSYIKFTYQNTDITVNLINTQTYETIFNILELPLNIEVSLDETEKRLYKDLSVKIYYLKEN